MALDDSGTSDWYRRAAVELAATSELQVAWATGVADDETVIALIDRLPREHRQPSLVFSVARWLGAPAAAWPALLEIGASAGLCLGIDAYSYRFDDEPVVGNGSPLLECRTSGSGYPPSRLPEIAWRRGIDLAPLTIDPSSDAADADIAWLEALLPPDRPERLARLRAACTTLAADPPEVVAGDAVSALPAVAATAPSGATLVIVALGTLVYLPPADRAAVATVAAGLGARLVTLEPVTALPEVAARLVALTAPEPTPFVLALDAEPLAYVSAHGDALSWLTPVRQPDAGVARA